MEMRRFYPSEEYDSTQDELSARGQALKKKWKKWWDRRDDDDDDPPPAPAATRLLGLFRSLTA
jgi:chemotaxis regulatin CheY-phosphate phosphatase CheZ